MPVDYNQIGSVNMQLVTALKTGATHAAGYPISDYLHDTAYNYDLSYGIHGINSKYMLKGTYTGTKYYCYNNQGVDMSKRIVHIHDRLDSTNPQTFYRLIHTAGEPGLRDNSYSKCDLITNIP